MKDNNSPQFLELKKRKDSTYGYSKENPINVTSIGAAYYYLDNLRYNSLPVSYNRVGSFSNSNDDMIDGYDIFIEKKAYIKIQQLKLPLYI